MTFSLKTIVKKSTRIVAAFLIAMVLSGVTVHTHQPDSRSNKYAVNVITAQITSVTYATVVGAPPPVSEDLPGSPQYQSQKTETVDAASAEVSKSA